MRDLRPEVIEQLKAFVLRVMAQQSLPIQPAVVISVDTAARTAVIDFDPDPNGIRTTGRVAGVPCRGGRPAVGATVDVLDNGGSHVILNGTEAW